MKQAGRAYLRRMRVRSILSMLLLFALAMAPLGMIGGSSAMAMDGPAMGRSAMAGMSHHAIAPATAPCHESHDDEKASDTSSLPGSCCVLMCVAIPAIDGQMDLPMLAAQLRHALPRTSGRHGLEPEADPPPPRLS